MTKISNRDVYREDLKVNELDFVVGSDYDDSLKTVNFRVRELADLMGISQSQLDDYFIQAENLVV